MMRRINDVTGDCIVLHDGEFIVAPFHKHYEYWADAIDDGDVGWGSVSSKGTSCTKS
jgi:hypothetical protein